MKHLYSSAELQAFLRQALKQIMFIALRIGYELMAFQGQGNEVLSVFRTIKNGNAMKG